MAKVHSGKPKQLLYWILYYNIDTHTLDLIW